MTIKVPIKYLIGVGLLISALTGCQKGSSTAPAPVISDTTKPTITIIKPTPGQSIDPGSTILFQATFSDNEKLKSYGIEISNVNKGGSILKNVPTSVPFSYTKPSTSFGLGTKQQDITLSDITIPANTTNKIVTPGKYYFKVTCVDGADNIAVTILEISIN
jgi:hypothetical protein